MTTMTTPRELTVGQESSRDSARFRWPLYDDEKRSWPWVALFEDQHVAQVAAFRYTDWARQRQQIADLEAHIAGSTIRLLTLWNRAHDARKKPRPWDDAPGAKRVQRKRAAR